MWQKRNPSSLGNIVEEFANLTTDTKSFNQILRKMSMMSEEVPEEDFEDDLSTMNGLPTAMATPGVEPTPQWGLFGDAWKDSIPAK
jgi:hypothetical protein